MNNFDDLFLQAREISDPAARAAFLDEACAHQPELRARLDALLADASAADAFFDEADTVERASKLVPQAATNSEVRVTPTHIGPYRILERIGHGGMGDVFRAVQKEPIRREVALKLIKLGMDTQQVIARFEAERQALALMDHPHIARVLDAGADDLGHPYFVMELVRGVPITQYADEKQLTLRERLALMQQVCQAIQHAHSKGVIHRDLKPSNILVSTQDGRPHAKVIDFGIAKATAQPLTDKTLFTQFQQFIGTPQYMSPEQAEGSLDIDTRSDVYALGVLLYELLTGGTPVEAATLRQAALHEIARIIKEQDTPKPSTRLLAVKPTSKLVLPDKPEGTNVDIRSTPTTLASLAKARNISAEALIKTVRGELDWLVMKALEKDRTRRYETPNQLSDDIARYLEGQPIVAAPPSRTYRMKKFIRKHRAPVLAAAAVLTLMTAGILGTSWGLVREKAAKEEATQQAKIADQERTRAEAEKAEAQKQKTEADQQRLTAETAKTTAEREREAAELESYIGNLAAAQAALTAHDYPGARARLAVCPEKLRGWEWRFLNEKANSIRCVFPENVMPLHFAPSGNQILVWDNTEKILRVCDLEGASVGIEIKLPVEYISSEWVAYTPDGGHLIWSSPYDRKVGIWSFVENRMLREFKVDQATPFDAEFSGLSLPVINDNGSTFAFYGLGNLFRTDGSVISLQSQGDSHPTAVRFIPDSNSVLMVCGELVKIFDLNGSALGNPMRHEGEVRHVQISHDGEWILTKTAHYAQRWDSRGNPVGPRMNCWEGNSLLSMSPDGNFTVRYLHGWGWTGWTQDGSLIPSGQFPPRSFEPDYKEEKLDTSEYYHPGWKELAGYPLYEPFEFSSDSRTIFINPYDKTWHLSDIGSSKNHAKSKVAGNSLDGRVCRTCWNSDGSEFIHLESEDSDEFTYFEDHTIVSLHDKKGHLLAEPLQLPMRMTNDFRVSVMAGIRGNHALISRATNSLETKFLRKKGEAPTSASLGLGTMVICLETFGSPLRSLENKRGGEMNFTHTREIDAAELYSLRKGEVDIKRGSEIEVIRSGKNKTGSRLIRQSGAAEVETLVDTHLRLSHACFDPDSQRLFAVNERTLFIWDARTKKELASIPHSGPVERLNLRSDGHQIVILYQDGHAEVLDARPASERKKAYEQRASQMDQMTAVAERIAQSRSQSAELRSVIEESHDKHELPLDADTDLKSHSVSQWVLRQLKGSSFTNFQIHLLTDALFEVYSEASSQAYDAKDLGYYKSSKPLNIQTDTLNELTHSGILRSHLAHVIFEQSAKDSYGLLFTERAQGKGYALTPEWIPRFCELGLLGHVQWRPDFQSEEFLNEVESALSLLPKTDSYRLASSFWGALTEYRRGPSLSSLEKVYQTLQMHGSQTQRYWSSLAWMHASEERLDAAKDCLNRLFAAFGSTILVSKELEPFGDSSQESAFHDVYFVQDKDDGMKTFSGDYKPLTPPSRIDEESKRYIKATLQIIEKAKTTRPRRHE